MRARKPHVDTDENVQTTAPASHAPAHSGELMRYYDAMSAALGPMRWWPAETPFEVIVGAILTQSTAWGNVELAIANLRAAKMLTPRAMLRVPSARLAALIRPSGYFRQKAKKLKAFVRFLNTGYKGSLARMFETPTDELRKQLLDVHGIGPETADSILSVRWQPSGFCSGRLYPSNSGAAWSYGWQGRLRKSARHDRKCDSAASGTF